MWQLGKAVGFDTFWQKGLGPEARGNHNRVEHYELGCILVVNAFILFGDLWISNWDHVER
jgi:hypothetical protein